MRPNRIAAVAPALAPRKCCAIYTRKSTDEGLDQDYNSLEAQRDAGLAFVASQRHEGWMAVPDGYDDGGYSGGNLERPGLKRLMADIEAGRIDIVVVYKIDRLTRSLTDFAKLVDVLDRNGVSFVSVTQQFNTTTSMGRLTLNILLSFAQFEREVTGERIRDKIAASKAKGMWMGGTPPLGYDVVERKLLVNEPEADLVRYIFRRYAEHGSAAELVRELAFEGRTTKAWQTQNGQFREGRPIDQQYLFKLLRNRIYLGEIQHKDTSFPGQHEAIIDQDTWDLVHAFVERRKQGPREGVTQHPALLAGLLHAHDGQLMIHSYTRKKNGRLYRYYVPYLHKRRNAGATLAPGVTDIGPLPAADIEAAVLEQIQQALRVPELMLATWRSCQKHPQGARLEEAQVVVAMQRIGAVWDQLFPKEQQRITQLLIERVQLHDRGLDILWREDGWLAAAQKLGLDTVPVVVLDHLTPTQRRALIIADNRIAENAGWDDAMLRIELQSLQEDGFNLDITGFDADALAEIMAGEETTVDGQTDDDAVPEVSATPISRPGDVWELGNHRLVCGDATDPKSYELLMADARANMVFTDPPYNVDYANSAKDKMRGKDRPILNDNLGDGFYDFLLAALTPMLERCAGATYIAMSSSELDTLQQAFRAAGGKWSTFIIWAKNTFTLGRADYQRQYEPILYGWPEGENRHWCGDRDQGDVWNIKKPQKNDLHPTMKPVELVERAIRNSSRSGDIVLDPFGGSGTTLIAAEKTGRIGWLIELDPKYVDVIVRRWQDWSGQDAYRERDGLPFNMLACEDQKISSDVE